MDLSKETVEPHLPVSFFVRGVLPVVAVLNWNYLRLVPVIGPSKDLVGAVIFFF